MNDPTERPARPGETCTCGRQATVVFITADHDDAPYCGVPHSVSPADEPIAQADDRFTWAMVVEVYDVLEGHGYRKASDAAGGRAVAVLLTMVETYEGRS